MTAMAVSKTLVLNKDCDDRVCKICLKTKPLSEFHPDKRYGRLRYMHVCHICHLTKMRKYYADNKHLWVACKKRFGPEHMKGIMRRYSRRLKAAVIDAYGGKCQCCGEDDLEFLTIEHSRHDGKKHRDDTNQKVYFDLKKRGYPQDLGITVLCWNCNMATRYGAVCPHKRGKQK